MPQDHVTLEVGGCRSAVRERVHAGAADRREGNAVGLELDVLGLVFKTAEAPGIWTNPTARAKQSRLAGEQGARFAEDGITGAELGRTGDVCVDGAAGAADLHCRVRVRALGCGTRPMLGMASLWKQR
jgi:hypothetical protein